MNESRAAHAVIRNVSTRQHIVDVARQVFATHGFGRTSLDAIGLEAGVSKMTIFYHFKNKEELVIASLEEAHRECMSSVLAEASTHLHEHPCLVRAIFRVLESRLSQHSLNDIYLRAVVEYGDTDTEVGAAIRAHFSEIEEKFRSILNEAGFDNTDELVPSLMLILMGLYAKHMTPGSPLRGAPVTRLVDAILNASDPVVA